MSRWPQILVSIALLLLPGLALACPVCFNMREEARQAFKDTAIFMTVLPFFFVGGVIWWVRRALSAAETDEAAATAAPPATNG